MTRPILLSGIQPSGYLTLGNYLGAIQQWKQLKKDHTSLFLVVDLHALTANPNPIHLHESILDTFALYLACGLNPSEEILFLQSQVQGHTELNWYLNCFTYFGELNRMTQFKEKSQKYQHLGINSGLFNYPCLMAADILLYQTQLVPVGDDQTQHLELTRTIAQRLNQLMGQALFTIPKRISPPTGARIMSLTHPTQKMSKSDADPNGRIELLDSPEIIEKKIKLAKTDSFNAVRYDRSTQPGIANLIEIYGALTSQSHQQVVDEFQQANYSTFKAALTTLLCETLVPIQEEFKRFRNNPSELMALADLGARRAEALAQPTLEAVRKALGLVARHH